MFSLPEYRLEDHAVLTAANRRSMCRLGFTIETMAVRFDIRRIAFGTLTFALPITETKIASDKLKSLLGYVRESFEGYLWVRGRHESGSIHFHVLLLCREDITTGCDLVALSQCSKADFLEKRLCLSKQAMGYWQKFEAAALSHGFGRAELMPIYSNIEAVARYLVGQAKLTWNCGFRREMRRQPWWRYSKNVQATNNRFSFNIPRLRRLYDDFRIACGCEDEDELRTLLGPKCPFYAFRWEEQKRVSVLSVIPSKLRRQVERSLRKAGLGDPMMQSNPRWSGAKATGLASTRA